MKNLMPCCSTTKYPPSSGDQTRPLPPMIIDSESSWPSPSSPFEINSEPDESEPDISAILASGRFFFSSPGCSNSIVESSPSVSTAPSASPSSSTSNGSRRSSSPPAVVIDRYSSDPYADFKRSMEEMVEARGLHDVRASWDFLHELLLCYLVLNHKSVHRFITGAFAELLAALMFP